METLALVAIVGIVFFVLVRSFWLWYWKVDQQIALLTEIRDSLRASAVPAKRSPSAPPVDADDAETRRYIESLGRR